MNLNIGDEICVDNNNNIGYVIILDIQDEYIILFKKDGSKFIKANRYSIKFGRLVWDSGEYYSTLDELIEGLIYENILNG